MLMTPPALHTPLADARGRRKRKLRLSLTDRCNLRCVYCMPEHPQWLPRDTLLDGAELQRLARLFVARLGISEIRLTGGEPLLRAEITQITTALDALRAEGLERLALTSNGVRLDRLAAPLRAAGLDDLNVSLDAVTPQGFARLTGGDLAPVLRGIDAARAAGLPVKINSVILRGHNEDEVLPLVRWALAEHLPLRFIEFMPLDGRGYWNAERVVREDEILAQLAPHYTIEAEAPSDDPAHYFRIDGRYALGMISTVSKPFCRRCDRVRVSATGRLYSCLFSADGPDLRTMLREGADDDAIEARMRAHVWHKEAGYAERPGYVERPITMHVMGG
ncbi:GTP 3',8-cyclase MoaA [Sinimarinibacterium flocculans]|mgnify:CR=1 FL=1|uniref:GTP 3',8-cyclase n=1 Tax=Sinimarinibacterium flocculans TaxID=985250 RepID=A0A318E254_9GAMM|nr:GTP 3',8-cyclase MoaA [Sinimarinibacterium flocculans]PXV64990.1 cyclic pyranopterin monophosphate synthase subunit MoaA [Sinimarinibacterium flocculans]